MTDITNWRMEFRATMPIVTQLTNLTDAAEQAAVAISRSIPLKFTKELTLYDYLKIVGIQPLWSRYTPGQRELERNRRRR